MQEQENPPAPETPPEVQPEAAPPPSELELALAERDKALAEAAALKDQLLRTLAEQENQRKRWLKEREDATRFAAMGLLRDLVGAADNLARALSAVPAEALESDPALKQLREGVALTERELLSAFEKHGVRRIDPLGQPLDPHLHEAMFEVPTADATPGTVVQVLEAGWQLHDRLIRPARVGVAKAL